MPTLAELRAMKRPELQALCKGIGQKANGKTAALLDALIQHFDLDGNDTATSTATSATQAPKAQTAASSADPAAARQSKATTPAPVSSAVEEDEEDEVQLAVPAPKKTAGKRATPQPSASSLSSTTTPSLPQQTVYATSPATKSTIASLLSTVQNLQAELASTRTALVKLEGIVSAPPPPPPKLDDSAITTLISDKVDALRVEITTALDARFVDVEQRMEKLETEPRDLAEEEVIKELVGQLNAQRESTDIWKAEVEVAINSLWNETSRSVQADLSPASATPQIQHHRSASPTPSDAPPIETLASFSAPPTPAIGSPVAQAATPPSLSRRSPRKIPSTAPALASALPPHMLAGASPSLRSPRGRARSSTIATPHPQSPARPIVATPNLGKHGRGSDASELSFAVDVMEKEATRSPEKSEGHARKRMRVSAAGSVEEETAQAQESFASTEDDSSQESTPHAIEQSLIQVTRDFVVQTKTGSPTRPSTSDPSFFSALPSGSPAPSSARKSLPMASLPFPLVNPHARKSLGFGGTPASSRKSSFFSDATNAAPTPPAARTLYGSERETSLSFADADVEEMEGEGARFDDVSIEVSPRKPWGVGMFGRA